MMTWIADLSTWDYMGFSLPHLKAIGWLSREHTFPTGDVSEEVFLAVGKLVGKHVTPWAAAGFHDCEICRFTGGFWEQQYHPARAGGVRQGVLVRGKSKAEIIVPGKGCLYIAPENIGHYIDSHGYCPPNEFQEAAIKCPDVETQEYKLAFLANGGRELMMHLKSLRPIG